MSETDPPEGSRILVRRDGDELTLSWREFGFSPMRYALAGFVMLCLCVWVVGLVGLARLSWPLGFALGDAALVLVVWLAVAALAGAVLYVFVRPQRPERITLGRDRFTYDTGTALPGFLNPSYNALGYRQDWRVRVSRRLRGRKIYAYSRSECPKFVLGGSSPELGFDDGAERIAIGESLSEPEREWLARLVSEWQDGRVASVP